MNTLKWTIAAVALLSATFLLASNIAVTRYGAQSTQVLDSLPSAHACLVLGTNKRLSDGRHNLFYQYRMEAAAKVYLAGKCQKIVVSGANPTASYNEPEEMKRSLMEKGVPAAAIACDYAGSRTLDSVLRFKHIFGQSSGIVISQEFHNARAIYIAQHHALQLSGFNAQDVEAYQAFKTRVREIFSKGRAVLDVMVLGSEPRHYGEAIAL